MSSAAGASSCGGAWPLIGRAAELALATQLLNDDQVRGLVLAGPPGVGKTRLAQEILRRAETDGWATRWIVASLGSGTLPLGAFTPLLPNLRGVSHFELLGRVAAHLVAQAEGGHLLLGVDDAQWLDETSAALVHQLATTGAAFVVLTVRRAVPVPDPITAFWKDGLGVRLEVMPLARAESHELVAAVLDGPIDGTTLHELFEYSRGNVLFLRELVLGGLANGQLAASGGVWRWSGPVTASPRLVELIEARMSWLSPIQRAALEVVAFGEPLPAEVVEAMGEDITAPLDALERAGLIAVEPAGRRLPLRLAHPLYGEVLRAQTPVLRARAVHRQLARALAAQGELDPTDTMRVVTWRLAGGERGEPLGLTVAADHALQSLDHHRAEELARAAIVAGAGPPARRILAIALARRGQAPQAEVMFASITAGELEDADRVSTAIARAVNLQWRLGRAGDATAVLDNAIGNVGDPGKRAELLAVKAGFLVYDLNCAEALRLVRPMLDKPDVDPFARLRALAVASEALAATGRCDAAAALAQQALELAARMPQADALLRLSLNIAQVSSTLWAGRLAEARALAEAGYRAAIARHSSFETAAFAGWLAAVARSEGRLETARTLTRQAVERGRAPDVRAFRRFLPRLLAELARTTAMCGDVPGAEAARDEAHALDDPPSGIGQFWAAMAEPWIAASRGATSRAVVLSLRVADQAADLGLATLQLVALHDAIRFDPAADLAPRITRLAAKVEGPLPASYATHARALAAGDGVGLDQVAEQFSTHGAVLLAAEAATHAAIAHRRHGATTNALASANRARTWASQCEGTRTPALRLLEAPPELTPREQEIARLAAGGDSSKDIARQLAISARTVDNALHDVYTKLGIKRRTDLRPILGDPPAAREAQDQAMHDRWRPATK